MPHPQKTTYTQWSHKHFHTHIRNTLDAFEMYWQIYARVLRALVPAESTHKCVAAQSSAHKVPSHALVVVVANNILGEFVY